MPFRCAINGSGSRLNHFPFPCAATVDAMLLGKRPRCEYRKIDTGGGYDINDGTESESEESERETGSGYRRRTEESNGRRFRSAAEVSIEAATYE